MIKVGIIGATGYAGGELVRILTAHKETEIVWYGSCLLYTSEPLLHIAWNETLGEVHAQLMGAVQIEVLQRLIAERFGVHVNFGAGNIVYKETIADIVEGVGHFEPLRHYAEVHLLMEPGERGSGLQFFSDCSEDVLDRNWQRLILTHLEEKEHLGVLVGAPITDMRITLASGRAHQKHTEGGDFRQATYLSLIHIYCSDYCETERSSAYVGTGCRRRSRAQSRFHYCSLSSCAWGRWEFDRVCRRDGKEDCIIKNREHRSKRKMNEKTKKIVMAAAAVVIACLSFFVVAKTVSSPEFHAKTIACLLYTSRCV